MSDELTRCHIFPSLDSKTGWYCSSCHKDAPEYGCHRAGLKSASDSARNGEFQAIEDGKQKSMVKSSDSAKNGAFQAVQREDGQTPNWVDVSLKEQDGQKVLALTRPSASDSAKNGAFQTIESRSFWRRVEPYPSHGRTYYRYRWGRGQTIEGVRHVPGGNQDNPIVQSRAIALWRAVNLDALPHVQVLKMVENWRCRKRSRR